MRRRALPSRSGSRGFTYLGVLFLIAVIGLVSTASVQVGKIQQRRVAEEELLAIGAEFRNAFIAYANATPLGYARAPSSLGDLLRDPRFPDPRRYLRKIYIDPMTAKPEWGTVPALEGPGFVGVYSLSTQEPIKIGNFPEVFSGFDAKSSYREWQFVAPQMPIVTPQPPFSPS